MNTTALRRRPQWLIVGTLVLAAAVGGSLRIFLAPQDTINQAALPESEQPVEPSEAQESPVLFQSPMVTLSNRLQTVASPAELVVSTSSVDRLSVISAGRTDPFAPITKAVGSPRQTVSPEDIVSGNEVSPNSSQPLPTAPVSNVPDLPPVPVVNLPTAPVPLPSIPIATSPITIPALPSLPSILPESATTAQDPIAAIELTGVVQVGNRVGVIVRESGQTSRHLFVGDRLANGQIRVKSIDLSAQEPLVILEYQGKEYPRIVG